jgi:hypothetical protein
MSIISLFGEKIWRSKFLFGEIELLFGETSSRFGEKHGEIIALWQKRIALWRKNIELSSRFNWVQKGQPLSKYDVVVLRFVFFSLRTTLIFFLYRFIFLTKLEVRHLLVQVLFLCIFPLHFV